jgi:hypothetical protein
MRVALQIPVGICTNRKSKVAFDTLFGLHPIHLFISSPLHVFASVSSCPLCHSSLLQSHNQHPFGQAFTPLLHPGHPHGSGVDK